MTTSCGDLQWVFLSQVPRNIFPVPSSEFASPLGFHGFSLACFWTLLRHTLIPLIDVCHLPPGPPHNPWVGLILLFNVDVWLLATPFHFRGVFPGLDPGNVGIWDGSNMVQQEFSPFHHPLEHKKHAELAYLFRVGLLVHQKVGVLYLWPVY